MGLLEHVKSPADLRGLDPHELTELAAEIRALLVDRVSRNGGHLGPNLGVVELTLALHRVFDSPRDALVWDTGHQAYVHKLLTGRAAAFTTLRTRGGLSGYPSRAESPHDLVENSHASTALSYADGLARARQLRREPGHTVAVIGDGALTGGMSWEAVNNIAAAPDRPLVVVINDNGRSYAPTVGGLADHLAALRTSRRYEELLDRAKHTLRGVPAVGDTVYHALHGAKKGLKDFLAPQALYEDLGLKYVGPVDGHDRPAVEAALRRARDFGGSVVVHCITEKGRGYPPAEEDTRDRFHAVRAEPAPGAAAATGTGWTAAFGQELLAAARARPDVVAVTAAMLEPTGLYLLQQALPEQVVDVGIAEQHAVTSAAGMAMGGLHPVVCVYATFLNRAFDQVLMDVALHGLPVTLVLDRAGITGDDGPSHNGVWDLAAFQAVPGLRIAAPRDRDSLREEFGEALGTTDGPTLLRFPKGALGPALPALERITGPDGNTVDVLVRTGEDVLLIAVGALAGPCAEAARRLAEWGVGCTVVDPRWVKPVPLALVELARRFATVVTAEDGVRTGGVGETTAAALRDAGVVPARLRVLGVPGRFLEHAARSELLRECGLTAGRLAEQVRDVVTARTRPLAHDTTSNGTSLKGVV
ncbi:1-deoxy-D-xylulose-5-phosphate synthase [Streptomyces sp. NPDC051162]|uniref:1-deoxy-D-xylulose-5-phosphate synthase n=1 Tax=unclassified Streptomyces TaxID=2593676 RepID=UPI00343F4981